MFFKREEPSKGKLIGYWVTTVAIAGVMFLSGVMDLMQNPEIVKIIKHLGYPLYFVTILGVAKVLGAVTVVVPGFTRLKEWAYAGISIDLLAGAISHAAVGDPISKIAPPAVLLLICMASYFLRPPSRVLIAS